MKSIAKSLYNNRYLYLLFIPGIIIIFIFKYIPMYGVVIAFKEFNMFAGMNESPWVGFLQFQRLFRDPRFTQVIWNTIIISLMKLAVGFPAPILLALLLNEVKSKKFKNFTQAVVYLPHFISWVVFAGIISSFLDPVDGVVNEVVKTFNNGVAIDFLIRKDMFRQLLVVTDVYKGIGWGTIIYLAAFAGVDPALYEAAIMDGANRFQRMVHITIPSVKSVIITLLILSLGSILDGGFEQVYMLYNALVYEVGDIIDTYVFRQGIIQANYSLGTAAGLFKSIVALMLIVIANTVAKYFGEEGVW